MNLGDIPANADYTEADRQERFYISLHNRGQIGGAGGPYATPAVHSNLSFVVPADRCRDDGTLPLMVRAGGAIYMPASIYHRFYIAVNGVDIPVASIITPITSHLHMGGCLAVRANAGSTIAFKVGGPTAQWGGENGAFLTAWEV